MSWHIFSNVRIDQFAKSDLCPSNPHRGQEVHDEEIYKRQVPPKTVFWITPSCVSCFGAIDGTQDDQSHIRWGKIEILWRERWSTILHSRSSICICVIIFVFLHLYLYLSLRDENSLEGEMVNHPALKIIYLRSVRTAAHCLLCFCASWTSVYSASPFDRFCEKDIYSNWCSLLLRIDNHPRVRS